jgi:hypothetical protein
VPREKVPSSRAVSNGNEPRARAKLRAERFATWTDLYAAVMTFCREEIKGQAPSLDVTRLERTAQRLAPTEEEDAFWGANRACRKVIAALLEALDYLEAHPDKMTVAFYAAMLAGVPPLSPPIKGRDRPNVGAVRNAKRPHTQSLRTRLVTAFGRTPDAFWWRGRSPSVRDLAILSLLAGCIPESAKKRQHGAAGQADRPTMIDVVLAEENAIRAAMTQTIPQRLSQTVKKFGMAGALCSASGPCRSCSSASSSRS